MNCTPKILTPLENEQLKIKLFPQIRLKLAIIRHLIVHGIFVVCLQRG